MGRSEGSSRTAVIGVVVVVVLALAVGGFFWRQQAAERDADRAATAAARQVAKALQDATLTDAPFEDPAAAQTSYEAVVAGLGNARPTVELGTLTRTEGTATAPITLSWPFGPDGWASTSTLPLTADPETGAWTAAWSPGLVHPELGAADVLSAKRTTAPRAEVIGPDGTPIVSDQPVVRVGVQPSRVKDLGQLTTTLADLLEVDAAALSERISAAAPEAFVDVITLRRPDYDALKAQLQPLPGTVFAESTQPLAPTREFARALLGTVGPATAELIEASEERLAPGDETGLSGLQRSDDAQLAGSPGVLVEKVSGEQRAELFTVEPVAGQPVTLTLDTQVQRAADAALASVLTSGSLGADGGNGNAALVAVSVQTGAVLAVANTPAAGSNRALTGQYPPGSTFKAISAQALLASGVGPEQQVPCPATATVEGRSFRNFEGGELGPATFAQDFAASCNTAFVGLSAQLGDDALTAAAAPMGIGLPWTVGVDAFPGEVPTTTSTVDRAAATIGQGRTLVSPLAMAVAVGSIARGSFLDPTLVEPGTDTDAVSAPEPVADTAVVRELMRSVVTQGTASALADVPGEPVFAKTGTAEFGTASPPLTHGWTIGFQGDVAFAVLVEEGTSGGRSAVPVAEAFLRGLRG